MKLKYSLPFRLHPAIRRTTAPSHGKDKGSPDRHCIDFYVPHFTPVRAARPGIVILRESRWNSTFTDRNMRYAGNGVVIRHSDGEESVYWHAAWRSVRVAVGQRVRRGQILFHSGQTGYATYPHTHFGVYEGPDESSKSIVPDFREPLPTKVSYRRYVK